MAGGRGWKEGGKERERDRERGGREGEKEREGDILIESPPLQSREASNYLGVSKLP